MNYLYCFLLLLLAPRLSAQPPHRGQRLITGVLCDSARPTLPGTIYIGASLLRAQQALSRQAEALRLAEENGDAAQAALAPAWQQLQDRYAALDRLRRDSTRVIQPHWQTGRFRFWARSSDTLYVVASRHLPRHYRVADLPNRGRNLRLQLQSEPCVPYVPCSDTTGQEYAFIGRKVSLHYQPPTFYCGGQLSMDSQYAARYQLLHQLQGRYPHDTMAFTAYDHYGRPKFGQHEHVLLFVQDYCGRLIHQKYQFYPVYRTADGHWAAPYNWRDDLNPELEQPIKPHPIAFAEPVRIDVRQVAAEYLPRRYPLPYYRIENGQALAVYGNYVEEILENRRQLEPLRRILQRRAEARLRAK